jgi:hypothetical protein
MLLEERVSEADVQIFLDLIGKKGPMKMYMDFVSAICSCKGEAVVQNQELVLTNAYSAMQRTGDVHAAYRVQLLMETAFDTTSRKRKWVSKSDRDLRKDMKVDKDYDLSDHHGDFLGKPLYQEGMHSIVVSWSTPQGADRWSPGCGTLFYKPTTLKYGMSSFSQTPADLQAYSTRTGTDVTKGRKWVPLHELVQRHGGHGGYITTPDAEDMDLEMSMSGGFGSGSALKRMATASSSRSLISDSNAEFDVDAARLQLVEYYLAMLELYTQLCADQSTNCIITIEKQFSYELVLSAIADQERLPQPMQQAFCNLIVNLYIRRYPHEALTNPSTVRVYSQIWANKDINAGDALPQFALGADHEYRKRDAPFYSCSSSKKFHLLQDFISDYFEYLSSKPAIMADSETNQLSLALMSCVQVS